MKPNLLQRFFSYLYPVKIASAAGKTTPLLGLYRFQGRWQLSAATALYSDGAAYRPLSAAFSYLKKELPQKQSMLVLGAGLGSAVSVWYKMGFNVPPTTLVDIDPQIITWGKALLKEETGNNCDWICADVQDYVSRKQPYYDLVILDIFQDRIVPGFVTTIAFLNNCKQLLEPGNSVLVLNYIINNEENWKTALHHIKSVFTIEHTIPMGINRILILRNNA